MATTIVFGLHALQSLLDQQPEHVLELFALEDRRDARLQALLAQAELLGLAVHWRTREQLDKLCEGGQHQGLAARIRERPAASENDLWDILDALQEPPFLLLLDGVTDPHNLGACLRSAAAAGVHAVVAPRDRAVGLTAVVRKVAVGATEVLPFIQVTNLARCMGLLAERGLFIVGLAADEAGPAIYDSDLRGPLALVLGGEGEGMRRLTRERCDQLAHIPMHRHIESLNVSVATGVALFEALRQRRNPPT